MVLSLNIIKSINWTSKPNIVHYGIDGFAHQLEGILGGIAMHYCNKVNYIFTYDREYTFQHSNKLKKIQCINYIKKVYSNLLKIYPQKKTNLSRVHIHETYLIPENPDNNIIYSIDNTYHEPAEYLFRSSDFIKSIFRKDNEYLPKPSYNNEKYNIVIHIRKGDALQRQRELDRLELAIKHLQNTQKNTLITIHSNGSVLEYKNESNTKLFDKDTHVLQVLSDMIHADIMIMSQSAVSSVAAWLTDSKEIYGPDFFQNNHVGKRLPKGFKKYSDLFDL